jgi:hypothetical protein
MNRFSRGIILLGHSDIAITLRTYSHLLPSMQQEVVDTWDGVFQKEEKRMMMVQEYFSLGNIKQGRKLSCELASRLTLSRGERI